MSNMVPCNNAAHGVQFHIVGTQAATDCAKGVTAATGRSVIPSTIPSSGSLYGANFADMTMEQATALVGESTRESFSMTDEEAVAHARDTLRLPGTPYVPGSTEFEDFGDATSHAFKMALQSAEPESNSFAPFIPRARRSTLTPENRAHLDTIESGRRADVIIDKVDDSDIIANVNYDGNRDLFAVADSAAVTSMNLHGGRSVGAFDYGGSGNLTLSDGSSYRSAWAPQYMDTEESAAGDMTREEVEALGKAADYVSETTFVDSVDKGNAATEIMNALQNYKK